MTAAATAAKKEAQRRVDPTQGCVDRLTRQLAAVDSEISAEAEAREARIKSGFPPPMRAPIVFRNCAGKEFRLANLQELRDAIRTELTMQSENLAQAQRDLETAENNLAWPAPDFLNTAMRLRYELETAIRVEQQLTQRVAGIENTAFAKGLPPALVAGGADKLARLAEEQNAATLAVSEKRNALRRFQESERARFFSIRDQAYERLRPGISEAFARAQKAAAELRTALTELLGAEPECARQETVIRKWNRAAKKFNRTIPSANISGIPTAAGIGSGDSLRSNIVGMLLSDANVRELCRSILTRDAEQRERAAQLEEARIAQAEATANPASLVEPF